MNMNAVGGGILFSVKADWIEAYVLSVFYTWLVSAEYIVYLVGSTEIMIVGYLWVITRP
jgi:hypothetical protein